MLHRLRSTSVRLATVALSVGALVTACSPNPTDWVEARWEPLAVLTQRCPNIEGTFGLRGGSRHPLSQTVFASYATSSTPRFPWETMTLSGDADDSLVLTVARSQSQRDAYRDAVFQRGEYYEREYRRMHSPAVRWSSGFATMTDAEYEENLETLYLPPVRSYTLHRREHYTCTGGWLRVDRVVHDPGPDRNNPRPDTVIGEVLLRKGWKGDLVAMAKYREAQAFTVWCGDGCKGIPLGTWTVRTWGRWRSTTVASDGTSPRPWAEPFEAAPVAVSDRPPDTPPEDIAREVRPMLPAGLQLQSVSRDGVGYRALLAGRSTTPFTQLVSTLRRSYRFRHERVVGLSRSAGGEWVLALSLGDIWRDSPANPRDPTGPLAKALPDGVRMVGVSGAGKGLEVTLVSKEQPPMDDAVRAIARLSAYDSVAVKSSIRSTYDQAIVTIVYVRERAEP